MDLYLTMLRNGKKETTYAFEAGEEVTRETFDRVIRAYAKSLPETPQRLAWGEAAARISEEMWKSFGLAPKGTVSRIDSLHFSEYGFEADKNVVPMALDELLERAENGEFAVKRTYGTGDLKISRMPGDDGSLKTAKLLIECGDEPRIVDLSMLALVLNSIFGKEKMLYFMDGVSDYDRLKAKSDSFFK